MKEPRLPDSAWVAILLALISVLWYAGVERTDALRLAQYEALHAPKAAAWTEREEQAANRAAWLQPEAAGDCRDAYSRALSAAATPVDTPSEAGALIAAVEEGLRSVTCTAVPAIALDDGVARATKVAASLVTQARRSLGRGDQPEAVRLLLYAVWFGEDLGRHGGVQTQIAGVGASRKGLEALRDSVAEGALDGPALSDLQGGIDRAIGSRRSMADALEGESLIAEGILLSHARAASPFPKPWRGRWHWRGAIMEGMRGVLGHLYGLRTAAQEAGRCHLAVLGANTSGADLVYGRKRYFPLIAGFLHEDNEVLADTEELALLRGVRLQVALARWRLAHGSYPETLDALGEPQTSPVVVDPFSGDRERCRPMAFAYRPMAWKVVSVGRNGELDLDGSSSPGDDLVFPLPN